MRRTVLTILVSFICALCMGQTTIINGSWTSGTTECGRLKSVEIQDNGVVVTIEVKALKALKRLQIFSTYNTYITSGNYQLLQLSGLVVGNEIKSCGSGTNWGWDKVAIGETRSYQLFFKGALPPGVTTISIIDNGDYNGAHGYCFRNYNINNPRKNYSSINSEYLAKKNIDSNNDGICGIYEQIAGEQNYKLACIKENGQHKLIYLSSSTNIPWWQPGDIKANLRASASGIFKADWFMANKSVNKDAYLVFDGLSMTLNMPTGTDPGETKYLKMYPENSPGISGGSNTNQGSSWTGTCPWCPGPHTGSCATVRTARTLPRRSSSRYGRMRLRLTNATACPHGFTGSRAISASTACVDADSWIYSPSVPLSMSRLPLQPCLLKRTS